MTTSTLEDRLRIKPRRKLGKRGEWLLLMAFYTYWRSSAGSARGGGAWDKFCTFLVVLSKFYPLQKTELWQGSQKDSWLYNIHQLYLCHNQREEMLELWHEALTEEDSKWITWACGVLG